MRLSVQQFKGGAGKSTVCELLASALAHQNRKVVLFDMDPQKSLVKWDNNARRARQTSEFIEVVPHDTFDALASDIDGRLRDPDLSYIIDTQGEAADIQLLVAQIVELIIVPTRLNAADATEAIEVFRTLDNLLDRVGDTSKVAPSYLAFTLTEARSKWTKEAQAFHRHLSEIPHFETCIRRMSGYEKMQSRGPLPALIDLLSGSADARVRIQATEFMSALQNAEEFLTEVDSTIAGLQNV